VSPKTVLVVEDSEATRRLIELSLSIDGFNVEQRDDGESGLEAAKALLPDVIVLDIALPAMNGWEVLTHLRGDPATRDIPVVVVTAHDSDAIRTKAHTETADAFIGKPFELTVLRTTVRKLAGQDATQTAAAE